MIVQLENAATQRAEVHGELDVVRNGLTAVASELREQGLPTPPLEGKLLRPSFALAMVGSDRWPQLDRRFWKGALAIQMAHEASLLHDDILDGATTRRGRPTVAQGRGTGVALVLGDHLLTASYRAAAATGSFEFMTRYAEAVERTVAGEIAQGSRAGEVMTLPEYDASITGKSGELFGAAAVLGGTVLGMHDAELRHCLGCSFGNLYQRIDDLLDYCPSAQTGKPPMQDFRQGKWSWILELAGIDSFDVEEDEVEDRIFRARPNGPSPARRALEILRERKRLLLRHASSVGADPGLLERLVARCVGAAEGGVESQEHALARADRAVSYSAFAARPGAGDGSRIPLDTLHSQEAEVVGRLAARLDGPRAWRAYFGEHARTFHLTARLFPPRQAGLVAGLYAYCRFTDDLVDDPEDTASIERIQARLSVWRKLSLDAYEGRPTGIALLDSVMGDAAELGVARQYPEALLDGVAMDLAPRAYRSWSELERYTFGVAGAVGGWMSQLFGLRDPELLERAHALGHGMQLTNIARDVGEDWRLGRSYLPTELLVGHDVSPDAITRMARGTQPISSGYREAVQELLERADGYYDAAWPGIRALPTFFRRPVAAAAVAYRGIHREIRRNGYDNLTRRAHTSTARKVLLASAGLLESRRAS